MIDLMFALNRKLRMRQAAAAILSKNLAALERALDLGAEPSGVARRCERGYRGKYDHLLHVAVQQKWPAGVHALMTAGADSEVRGGITDATAFFIAVNERHLPTIRALAEFGPNPQGLGWSIDHAALDQTMATLGWDYPNQASLVSVREMTAIELSEYHRDPEETALMQIATERYAIKQTGQTLEHHTPHATNLSKPMRL